MICFSFSDSELWCVLVISVMCLLVWCRVVRKVLVCGCSEIRCVILCLSLWIDRFSFWF